MVLYWHGKNSVSIESGGFTLLVDPLDLEKELKSAKPADVVLLSRPSGLKLPAKTVSFVIANPGEYDVKGFFILGFGGLNPSAGLGSGDGVAYTIESEGMRIVHLSLDKELTAAQLESLSDVDVLVIDVGVDDDINETAAKIVGQIEPRIVIPVGYDAVKKPMIFLKEMGASDVEGQNKLSLKKKDLPQEETKVVLLNAAK